MGGLLYDKLEMELNDKKKIVYLLENNNSNNNNKNGKTNKTF